MGNRNFKDEAKDKNTFVLKNAGTKEVGKEVSKKLLCLHGWRTSGSILSMQTAAFRANVDITCKFLDAPLDSEGPPDPGIATYYPDYKYFEWVYKRISGDNNSDIDCDSTDAEKLFRDGYYYYEGLEKSTDLIIDYLLKNGPFDGILGFSQGAAMTTRIAYLQENNDKRFENKKLFNFVILIGGVIPHDVAINMTKKISIPSLHLMGEKDPYFNDSKSLSNRIYEKDTKKVIIFNEGHNIPSIRTNIYPEVKEWIYSQSKLST